MFMLNTSSTKFQKRMAPQHRNNVQGAMTQLREIEPIFIFALQKNLNGGRCSLNSTRADSLTDS
jgi:hypothetical protein